MCPAAPSHRAESTETRDQGAPLWTIKCHFVLPLIAESLSGQWNNNPPLRFHAENWEGIPVCQEKAALFNGFFLLSRCSNPQAGFSGA